MVYYRLYAMRAPGGPLIGLDEIAAEDDVQAVRSAAARAGEVPMELWCGKRRVKSFPALEPVA